MPHLFSSAFQTLVAGLTGVLRLIEAKLAPAAPEGGIYVLIARMSVAKLALGLATLRPRPTVETETETETPPAERPPAAPAAPLGPEDFASTPVQAKTMAEFEQELADLQARVRDTVEAAAVQTTATQPAATQPAATPPTHERRERAPRRRTPRAGGRGWLDRDPDWIHTVSGQDMAEARAELHALLYQQRDWPGICAESPRLVRHIKDLCHMLGEPVPPWVRVRRKPRPKRPRGPTARERHAALLDALRHPCAPPEGPGLLPYSKRGLSGLLPGHNLPFPKRT